MDQEIMSPLWTHSNEKDALMTDEGSIEDFLIIPESCPIEDARKDIVYGSEEPFTGQRDQFSEWSFVAAFHRWNVGDRVPWDDFSKALIEMQTSQHLSDLVDKGLIDAIWDEKSGEVVFKAKQ
jgi:hypothetical protein